MEIYTPSEVGQLLNLTPETIRRYIRLGKLKAVKKGQTWLVLPEDIEKLTSSEWYQIERELNTGRPRKKWD